MQYFLIDASPQLTGSLDVGVSRRAIGSAIIVCEVINALISHPLIGACLSGLEPRLYDRNVIPTGGRYFAS